MISTIQRPPIEPRPEFANILKLEETYATGERDSAADRINRRFDRMMRQSGVSTAPGVVLRLCILGAITLSGTAFLLWENFLLTAVAAEVGALLPIGALMLLRARRQSKLRNQMPSMLDAFARVARGGYSWPRCLEIVAADTPAPLGVEIRQAVRRWEMGLGVDGALGELPERTSLPSMGMFVATLNIHDRVGGDLETALDNLAKRIRERATAKKRRPRRS
jgi:tight adherence protein B